MQWFTIGGTSPPSRLTIGWSETQLLSSHFYKWWTTALPSMTGIWCFSSFYRWIIKLLYLFLHLLIQISPLNHNCNALNVFFTVLSHNNARSENGQITVRERSEYSLTVLLTGSARDNIFKCLFWENFKKLSIQWQNDVVLRTIQSNFINFKLFGCF